jgi:subtilisin family serine protease
MGIEAVILSIPGNISAENALRAVRSRDPSGRYDYNHLYDFRLSTGASMRIKAEERSVRQALSRQRGFSIGIVDTPVDPQHPGLRGAQIVQRNFLGQGRAADPHHGTAVASILIDQRDGLLPAGRLFVASIFKESVRGDAIGAAVELAQAIDWMVAERVAVINMSLAGPHNLLLEQSVLRANMRGHVIVAAVGNAGPATRPLFPAAYGNVVGITAIDDKGGIYRRALRGPQVDFSALGVNVKGALGRDYAMHSGTSFASPFAAAVVALGHKQPDPRTAQVIMQQLARDAADLGPRGRDDIFGHGLIRVGAP